MTTTKEQLDAMRGEIDTLTGLLDHLTSMVTDRATANSRKADTAQGKADLAFNRAMASYDMLNKVQATLDLIPDQFKVAHARIEGIERQLGDLGERIRDAHCLRYSNTTRLAMVHAQVEKRLSPRKLPRWVTTRSSASWVASWASWCEANMRRLRL